LLRLVFNTNPIQVHNTLGSLGTYLKPEIYNAQNDTAHQVTSDKKKPSLAWVPLAPVLLRNCNAFDFVTSRPNGTCLDMWDLGKDDRTTGKGKMKHDTIELPSDSMEEGLRELLLDFLS
jgi:hypothetical protein